jgi:pentatricopeptide repeat protein
MASEGVEVDIVTWNTVIHGMSKDWRMKEAAQLHRSMVAAGVEPDTVK